MNELYINRYSARLAIEIPVVVVYVLVVIISFFCYLLFFIVNKLNAERHEFVEA
jgi:hypothetical protein